MGSESTSHTTEDFYFENTMILGKNWESGNKLEVKTFFLENTMIWENGDLSFCDDFGFIY